MKKTTMFQIGAIIFFIAASIAAIAIFALTKATNTGGSTKLLVWGTLDETAVSGMVQSLEIPQGDYTVTYKYKSEASFDAELVDALALQKGPDAIIIGEDHILQLENKLFVIPFANYPQRTFRDLFIQSGELLVRDQGIVGLPLAIDPLMMYWNRDMFTAAGLAQPPKYWDELYALAPKLSTYDTTLRITKSAVALGEYQNVLHAKDILLSLWSQAQGRAVEVAPITEETEGAPLASALRFYTQFSDPTKKTYSWNRSLPLSRDMFTAGNLAVYFGFASELPELQEKNGNLNFDVVALPQTRNRETPIGLGKIYAFSILKNSPAVQEAFMLGTALTTAEGNVKIAELLKLPPARRDLLATPPLDAWGPLFYLSAIQAVGWLDPNPAATDLVFKSVVDDVVAGRRSPAEAANDAEIQLDNLYPKR